MRDLLVFVPTIEFGGCERFFMKMCRSFASSGDWRLHLVAPQVSALDPLRADLQASLATTRGWSPTEELGDEGYTDYVAQEKAMLTHLEELDPACVFIAAPWLPSVSGAVRALELTGTPFLLSCQLVDEVLELPDDVVSSFQAVLRRGSGVISAVSKTNRSRLAEILHVDESAIRLISNGVTSNSTHSSFARREPFVLAVGRLVREKGYQLFIEAAGMACKEFDNCTWQWAGEGRESKEATALNAGYGEVVDLLGQRSDVPNLLRRAALYVHPSYMEGLSFALMEAMEMGTPIIASDIGENAELVVPGETGLLFRSGDASDLAEKLLWALRHQEDMKAMGVRAQSLVRRGYRAEDMVIALKNALEEVTSR